MSRKTKGILLIGSGVAVIGYLAWRYYTAKQTAATAAPTPVAPTVPDGTAGIAWLADLGRLFMPGSVFLP